jgi:hypothetical protein
MRVEITYLHQQDAPAGMKIVGTVDGEPLAYDAARQPHRLDPAGSVPLDPAAVNAALVPALTAAASSIWPRDWADGMSASLGVNRRGLQRDRILKNGLHPDILEALALLAHAPESRALGDMMLAIGTYASTHGDGPHPQDDLDRAEEALGTCMRVLRRLRRGKTDKSTDSDA